MGFYKKADEMNEKSEDMVKAIMKALGPELGGAVREIALLVKEAGGRAMLVGGAVRDAVSGAASVKDADIEVFGVAPERLKAAVASRFAFDECGASFGVLKIKGLDIDVSLPRRESKLGSGHKGFLVESDPGLSVEEAASRRDFTVNAIYMDPLEGVLEDPFDGVGDLSRRVLRHVSDKFSEDPLRVLRGMQFVARKCLVPAPETIALCRKIGMEGLPRERLMEEWSKLLLKGVSISAGLGFLRATGWVDYFPELARLIGCRQDPEWHPEGDVWNHTLMCLDAFAKNRVGDEYEDLVVGLAVLCHDFGKPATTYKDVKTGRIRSLGHDEAGVGPTISFLERLTNEERLLKDVPPLVRCHMRPFAMWRSKVGDGAVRRLALQVKRIDRLIRVAQADDAGRPPDLAGGTSGGEDLKWLANVAERLRIADAAPRPILMGRHLMELGMKPSTRFGEILKACFDAQIDGAFSDLDGAREFLLRNFPEVGGGVSARE